MTLIVDPQGHPRSNLTVPIDSPWILRISAPRGSNVVSVTVFEIFRVKIWTFHLLTLIGLTPQPKVTKMGDDVPPTLVYHTQKTSARSRQLCTKYVLPKFFTFWPLGANPWAKVHQKRRRSGGLRDLPACKISSLYANSCPRYPLPKFLRTNKQKKNKQ